MIITESVRRKYADYADKRGWSRRDGLIRAIRVLRPRLTLPDKQSSVAGMENVTSFITEILRLKSLPRTGWLLRGVRDVESIADHSFGVAWISMLIADRALAQGHKVDIARVLRMALLHDISEVRTGDLPSTVKPFFPGDSLHHANEQAARDALKPLGAQADPLLDVWREYEERKTLEARIVKAADKIDLLCQAREYEQGGARNLAEFFENADSDFANLGIEPLITDILSVLNRK